LNDASSTAPTPTGAVGSDGRRLPVGLLDQGDLLEESGGTTDALDLTTVAQDVRRMSDLAVTRAGARLDGMEIGERELVVPPHLVVRGTTAPPGGPVRTADR
jgi:hypothetical protein